MEDTYRTQINNSVSSLFARIGKRIAPEEMHRVRNAYLLAEEAHAGQFRKTGEPYIIHPIAVARIVAEELELGANTIIAAFLHDVVEDTPCTIEYIREGFGDDVAFLVEVVTKKKDGKSGQSKQVDNYRQILASVHFDVRAILLKLADRLHNMRTLESMRPDKQMKIAGETDYFYAPLANRLGLYHIKSELENLSFRYRCPKEYAEMEQMLLQDRQNGKEKLDSFIMKLEECLHSDNVRVEVCYRTPCSVWRKMQANSCGFNHVDGKHYIRLVYGGTDNLNAYQEKMSALHLYADMTGTFKERPGSVANYIDAPKENGYQSFHVKLLDDHGVWEEIHISSERMVRNSRLGCAAERTEENLSQWIEKFKNILQDIAFHGKDMDYMDGVTSSFYNDDIMVFTPKGKGIILPKGASALDFAYEIHSNIGRHAVYARVNGTLKSVKTVLQRGDCVEIGTDENSNPDKDWIDHVLTYKAKRYIRCYLSSLGRDGFQRCPHCHPLPGDEIVGVLASGELIVLHKRNCREAIRIASQHGDTIISVEFRECAHILYPVCLRIRGIGRQHLVSDIVECVVVKQHLSINRLSFEEIDHIAEGTMELAVHSARELEDAIKDIAIIKGVEEVQRICIN